MSEISVSKITNIVGFKTDANSYNQALKKIRKVTGAFAASQNSYKKSMAAGKQIATANLKTHDKLARAEIRANKTRRDTLKADQIRYKDQIKNNEQFRKALQKINSDFLLGNKSFKERSAAIGQLNKQYRQLNNNASKHNGIVGGIKSIAGRAAGSVAGTGVLGAGVVGAGGYAAHQGFNTVKATGQQFEGLNVKLDNVFGTRATEISNTIAAMSQKMGQPIIELGNQLVDSVNIMKALNVNTDEAIKLFELQTNATADLTNQQKEFFNYGASQMLASNSWEDFKQAFDNATGLRTSLFEYVQKKYGVDQNTFKNNITNGRFNLKEIWFGFLKDTQDFYAARAARFQNSSMANDARSGNNLSLAIYRIFESSGFKQAMKASTDIVNYWGSLLESNASKIGEIFGNLYSIARDLSKEGFGELSKWLQELTKEDITGYFSELKSSMQQFSDVMKRLFSFLDSVLPSAPDQKGAYYVQREKYWLDKGYSGQEAGRLADGEMRKQFNLGFTVPSLENSLVRMSAQNTSSTSNHQATLDLKINTEVNQPKLDSYVWATVETSQTRIFNQLLTGS